MKLAIILCCIAAAAYADDWRWQGNPYPKWHSHSYYRPAPLNKDGTVAETPEVKEATAAHLAAVIEARARAPTGGWNDGTWDDWHNKGDWRRSGIWRDDWRDWNRNGDWRVLDRKGDWRDWDNKGYLEGWRYGPRWNWRQAPLNLDGTVAETSSVRYLKAQHLAAHAKAEARLSHQDWWSHGPAYAKDHHYWPAPIHHIG